MKVEFSKIDGPCMERSPKTVRKCRVDDAVRP